MYGSYPKGLITMEIGSTIRHFREERGYTLDDLAGRAGISPSYLSEIERGHKRPSLKTLDKICSALNIPRETLIPAENSVGLGDKIRLVRQEKGLSLKDLSAKTGISFTYLSEIERGVLHPAADTLSKIASALEVPLSLLVSHTENWIGKKLKDVRESLGLTQSALAAQAGLSPAMIGQIEAGKVQPSLNTIEKIAKALGISPCYLLIARDQLEEMLASMGPDLRELLLNENVQAVLRQICYLNDKQLRFLLKFIEVFKQAQLE
ncbi:helix-turn-helix domain-containing protein [Neomoorella mulderi]|uniref:HTH-type transcriptional regulator SinR n=1 Tax=Moorella mulderi DSM 14980 TaxID=1122241 RepID=A0A151AW40_9FIRM|nr:helix-turn-helix transcriptional regulator [Moorella mulderi]KYH31866.1 HTH-type transcriptional regulator SinR [Moorella mulderi DSM 14980]